MKLTRQDKRDMRSLATTVYESQAKSSVLVMRVKDKLIAAELTGVVTAVEFYRITALMSTQMRAPLWEKYFIEKHGFNRVQPAENQGDMEKNGNYYEYKASGFNAKNELRLLQIRHWQNCDYIFQFISGEGADTFCLTKKQMKVEMKINKAHPAHGTKTVNLNNKMVEYMMTVKRERMNDVWMKKYFVADPLQIGVV